MKYSLPDPYTVLDCPLSKGQWKSAVHKAVYAYWVDNLKWRASFYSSLEFLCVSGYWPSKKHPLIQNIGCVSDVPRVHTKLKLVTGTTEYVSTRMRSMLPARYAIRPKRPLTGLQIRVRICKKNSYFSTKTHVVGTQKNCLNETVLLSTQNTCLN